MAHPRPLVQRGFESGWTLPHRPQDMPQTTRNYRCHHKPRDLLSGVHDMPQTTPQAIITITRLRTFSREFMTHPYQSRFLRSPMATSALTTVSLRVENVPRHHHVTSLFFPTHIIFQSFVQGPPPHNHIMDYHSFCFEANHHFWDQRCHIL